jgi:hypothetical protein
MKIRNLPFEELNEIEKSLVIKWFEENHKITIFAGLEFFECKNHPECNTLEGFWEAHREMDTEQGRYDGWSFGDDLEDAIAEKMLNKNG